MKTITSAMNLHLQQDVTTLATCWLITRTDTTVFGFTDFSEDITYGSVIYKAATGIDVSSIKTSAQLDVDNLEITSVLDSATITEADMLAGLWDSAAVEIFQINWADHSMGAISGRVGALGEVRTGRTKFVAELRGLTQVLQQNAGRIYSLLCDADLGDSRCGVSLAPYSSTGAIDSVTDGATFYSSDRAEGTGYFDYGKITFTSGLNTGLSMEVKTFAAGTIHTQMPLPFSIAPGDSYSIHAGCDKTRATCRDRFNNVINRRAFDDIPGVDKLVSGT